MASSIKDRTYDPDWIKDTNANLFLQQEQRLRHSTQRSHKQSNTNSVSNKRLSKFNSLVNKMTEEQISEELEKRNLSTSGDIDVQRVRIKNHFKAELTFGGNNGLSKIEQHFQYIAVVDFEATCDEGENPNYQHEIIEFPIVLIDTKQCTIVDQFRSYCRPTLKPLLTKFCTDLTGIEQHQVDNAPSFPEVLENAEKWLNDRNLLSSNKRRLAFATDGPWDFGKFLRLQCHFSSISYPRWAKRWINVRKEFANVYNGRRCGINKMLEKLGLCFDGRCHSGLDDATNIARIVLELMKDGRVLLFNEGLSASDPNFIATINENNEDEEDDSIVFQD